jgi:hypothetical protein
MPVLRQTEDYCLVAEGLSDGSEAIPHSKGPLVLKTLCQHCQQVLSAREVDLDADVPSDLEAALMGALDAAQALCHVCRDGQRDLLPRTWDEETGGVGAWRGLNTVGYCQGSVPGCDADEDCCACGVVACRAHGHVDVGDDPECPYLIIDREKDGLMGTSPEERDDAEDENA